MNGKIVIDENLIKLKGKNYDVTQLSPEEYESLLKYTPGIINAINGIGELGLKSQEKAYSTIEKAIDIFSDQLKNPNLSEEARDKLNDRIERMVEKSYQKDSEYKKWTIAVVGTVVGAVALSKSPEMRKTAVKLLTKIK